jgi:hypothetical protein
MLKTRSLTTLAAAVALTAAATPAVASASPIGNSAGEANQNVCVAQIACTYVNYKGTKPTDVVKKTGRLRSWTVSAGSTGGTVRLRVLRPAKHGRFLFVRSSALRTVTALGRNTFPSTLKVRKGDVLAMSNDTSGLYMRTATPERSIRYFNYDDPQTDGQKARTSRTVPALRLLLSAKTK